MSLLKLTKTELRIQQNRLTQFAHYLPTLQLKKSMLQLEVIAADAEIAELKTEFSLSQDKVKKIAPFLLEKVSMNLIECVEIVHLNKRIENIAGVDVATIEEIIFRDTPYSLFDTPIWVDRSIEILKEFVMLREKLFVAERKRHAMARELRDVSIRVNLFEKILIPRARENISKIRVFLGDQLLAAVAQAKVAKKKIMAQRL